MQQKMAIEKAAVAVIPQKKHGRIFNISNKTPQFSVIFYKSMIWKIPKHALNTLKREINQN